MLASSAAACSALTPSAKAKIELPALPPELQVCKPDGTCEPICVRPVLIPERDISRAEAEKLWRRDRLHFVACRMSAQAIADFYENLRKNFDATAK
ncbi:hypothetical protein EVC15_066 [Rhizobium phage RHph_N2_6]|nr:hypothetical protein EVC15_066 [Rhizobium phage RHph_N2_6]